MDENDVISIDPPAIPEAHLCEQGELHGADFDELPPGAQALLRRWGYRD